MPLTSLAPALAAGKIIAIPTDTIYGLAVDATNPDAVAALFALKHRAASQAIVVMVADIAAAEALAEINQDARPLLQQYWPGALTCVLPRKASADHFLSPALFRDIATIGIRIPNHEGVLSLLRHIGKPLAVTSANLSGKAPLNSAQEIQECFGNRVTFASESLPITPTSQQASTVIDMTQRPWRILRQGDVIITSLT